MICQTCGCEVIEGMQFCAAWYGYDSSLAVSMGAMGFFMGVGVKAVGSWLLDTAGFTIIGSAALMGVLLMIVLIVASFVGLPYFIWAFVQLIKSRSWLAEGRTELQSATC